MSILEILFTNKVKIKFNMLHFKLPRNIYSNINVYNTYPAIDCLQ